MVVSEDDAEADGPPDMTNTSYIDGGFCYKDISISDLDKSRSLAQTC